MLDHWPTGIRDTTAFPSVDVSISADFRQHLEAFTGLEGIGWGDYEAMAANSGLSISSERWRTYRKMYERLGLIYKGTDDRIHLSSLGEGLHRLKPEIAESKDKMLDKLRLTAATILSRYQLRNPADQFDLPDDCDVLPCICMWKAMLSLDNKLHYEEINRVLLWVMHMSQLESAIKRIKSGRQALGGNYVGKNEDELSGYLGNPAHVEPDMTQVRARMDAWFSLSGWGGLVIERDSDSEGFRNMVARAVPMVKKIVDNPPKYYEAKDVDDWFAYYLGSAAGVEEVAPSEGLDGLSERLQADLEAAGLKYDKELVSRLVSSCLSKPFVILTGLSGSGKTKLAQAFARWITPAKSDILSENTEVSRNFEVVAVGADWTSRDNILGYADALDPTKYVHSQALDLILRAVDNPRLPHFLILDEMNLSHVERYFADVLSTIETEEPLYLHSDAAPREGVPASLSRLPANLFIIGTVNIDETTYMFSPKVLDRANVIEFTVGRHDIESFLDNPQAIDFDALDGSGARFGEPFVSRANSNLSLESEDARRLKEELLLFFDVLSEYGLEFGFRSVTEMSRFMVNYKALQGAEWNLKNGIDAQILQKLLPKLHGSRRKLEPILCSLAALCYDEHVWDTTGTTLQNKDALKQRADAFGSLLDPDLHPLARNKDGSFLLPVESAYYPLSYGKLQRMLRLLDQNGFTSFAEA